MDWDSINPINYSFNKFKPKIASLLQSADDHARKIASGKIPSAAWPVMNSMRSVEPSSRFRMVENLRNFQLEEKSDKDQNLPRWRR
jgi:hypothetical protein